MRLFLILYCSKVSDNNDYETKVLILFDTAGFEGSVLSDIFHWRPHFDMTFFKELNGLKASFTIEKIDVSSAKGLVV